MYRLERTALDRYYHIAGELARSVPHLTREEQHFVRGKALESIGENHFGSRNKRGRDWVAGIGLPIESLWNSQDSYGIILLLGPIKPFFL